MSSSSYFALAAPPAPVRPVAITELPACHLWPGDVIRRGGRLYEVARCAVTPGLPVEVAAWRLVDGRAADDAPATFSLPAEEIVRRVPR